MSIKKYFLTVALSFILMGGAFYAGYTVANIFYNSTTAKSATKAEDVSVTTTPTVDASQPSPIEKEYNFMIKAEDNKLNLYKLEADGRITLVNSYDITLQLFPQNDINELKKGIKVKTEQEANQVIENFVS